MITSCRNWGRFADVLPGLKSIRPMTFYNAVKRLTAMLFQLSLDSTCAVHIFMLIPFFRLKRTTDTLIYLTNRLKYGRNDLIPRGRRNLGAACGARYGILKCQPSPPPGNRTGRLSPMHRTANIFTKTSKSGRSESWQTQEGKKGSAT